MSTPASKIRVRFAPSPTGHLHIGSLRSALFNWLFARHVGGTYLLRIEDTDVLRSTDEYLQSILSSFEWTKILPDEPVVFQMKRLAEHQKVARALLEQGKAYPCFCPPVDADERMKSLDEGFGSQYPGTCRNKPFSAEDLKKPHALRFKLQEMDSIGFDDMIRGPISFNTDQFDDFVIIRQDGVPTYNFVVVIDDIFMEISHIIRGEEHIPNTPKQLFLYHALGATPPIFAHLPMILGPTGAKLSKRDGAVSVKEYKEQGFLAQALINYIVRLGWSHGDQELFTQEELIKSFTVEAIGKKGAIFDIKKLEWVNGVYLRTLPVDELIEYARDLGHGLYDAMNQLWSKEQLRQLFELYRPRAVRLKEIVTDIIALASAPATLDLTLIEKWKTAQTAAALEDFINRLGGIDAPTVENITQIGKEVCEKFEIKLPQLAQPIRLALTGGVNSPGVFDIVFSLSIELAAERLKVLQKALN